MTLHAQYAGGFRAPPYSAVNSGFTNLQGGYTSVPNTDLDPETSDNIEVGVRTVVGPVSVGVTGFSNVLRRLHPAGARGVNPTTRLQSSSSTRTSRRSRFAGVELQGEARLRDGLRLRASYAVIRGDDVSADVDVPLQLDRAGPGRGRPGIRGARQGRWGSDLTRCAPSPASRRRRPEPGCSHRRPSPSSI